MNAGIYLENWLEEQRCVLQRSTYEGLSIYIRRHLVPYFGLYDLEEITPAQCQQYVTDKLEDGRIDRKGGLSAVSIRKHLSILKQALNEAVRSGLILQNPAQYVRTPRLAGTVAHRTVFLTPEEGQKLVVAFEGTDLYAAVVLALYYGLRRSEVLGLKWQAIDFSRNVITIQHTVVKNLTTETKDTTKTATSRRSFQLLPEVREILIELKKTALEGDYILTRGNGKPLRPDSLTKGFQAVLRRNSLPAMRFHDLRHSTASILFDRGWELEDVKNWLGHRDIETTSNIYLHYGRARKVMLAKNLEGMLIKAKKS